MAAGGRVAYLVGGYDGSGNYGDILLVAAARHLAEAAGASAIAVIEAAQLDRHRERTARAPTRLAVSVVAFDGHELQSVGGDGLPRPDVVYLYGRGYLNEWWGDRKLAMVHAVARAAGGQLPIVASGLQASASFLAHADSSWLRATSVIGARDGASLAALRAAAPADTTVFDSGDDTVGLLAGRRMRDRWAPTAAGTVVVHVSGASHVTADAWALSESVATLLRAIRPARIRPLSAYEDWWISDREMVTGMLARLGDEATEIDNVVSWPDYSTFGGAELTVTTSYHVALTSLLASTPVVLVVENDYYRQKAAGLVEDFGRSVAAVAPGELPPLGLPRVPPEMFERVVSRFMAGRRALTDALRR